MIRSSRSGPRDASQNAKEIKEGDDRDRHSEQPQENSLHAASLEQGPARPLIAVCCWHAVGRYREPYLQRAGRREVPRCGSGPWPEPLAGAAAWTIRMSRNRRMISGTEKRLRRRWLQSQSSIDIVAPRAPDTGLAVRLLGERLSLVSQTPHHNRVDGGLVADWRRVPSTRGARSAGAAWPGRTAAGRPALSGGNDDAILR